MASTSPLPLPVNAVAFTLEARTASPIEVKLFDENRRVSASVTVERDGSTDAETTKQVMHLFRCISTNREKVFAQRTLAMLADVAEHYDGKTIEFVSVYRARAGESSTSPHRAGRAIDFRIRGVALRDIRDFVWRKYKGIGVGWYPSEQFVHIDSRNDPTDIAWTFVNGTNRYHPYWADVARQPPRPPRDRRPGS